MEPMTLQATAEDAGKRLDAWLAEQTGLSRSALQRLAEEGQFICLHLIHYRLYHTICDSCVNFFTLKAGRRQPAGGPVLSL